jgi:hypothetical protein
LVGAIDALADIGTTGRSSGTIDRFDTTLPRVAAAGGDRVDPP